MTNVQMGFGRTIQSGSDSALMLTLCALQMLVLLLLLTRIAVTEGPMSNVLLEEAGVAG